MIGNLLEQFNSQHFGVGMKLSRKDLGSAVVRRATKRLIGRSLQLRRKYAGFLFRCIKSITLKTQERAIIPRAPSFIFMRQLTCM